MDEVAVLKPFVEIPEECTDWPVIGMFGSKEFSDPGLVRTVLRKLRNQQLVILTGVNGVVCNEVADFLKNSVAPRIVQIGPDLTGLHPKMRDYTIHVFNRTTAADELLLEMGGRHIAFSAGTRTTANMILSCRVVHKKPYEVIWDPKLPPRRSLAERIADRRQQAQVK